MREAGILLPLASLPNEFGVGDFGRSAYQFIDCIAAAGVQIWQILPLNPLGYGNSPYQPFSSYAGDDIYISLEKLCEYGLLTEEECYAVPTSDRILYEAVRKKKEPCFELRIQGFRRIPYIWNLLRKSLGCVTMRCFAHAKRNMDIPVGRNGRKMQKRNLMKMRFVLRCFCSICL